jgi:hypothetical protein
MISMPKHSYLRSETYRRWVASLACAHCQRSGPSQCAHSDYGKGLGLKSSDSGCFPLCADGPEHTGCHWLLGASGRLTRERRREKEAEYSARTRALAIESGNYPNGWE